MGSFEGTCGVTQLPIYSGDPMKLLLLSKVPTDDVAGGFCYPNGMWSLRALPVAGEYNDYGSIENYKENWNTDFIVSELKKDAVAKPVGKNQYHDLAVEPDKFTFENILELIHESRLEVKIPVPNPGTSTCQIGMMFVHNFVWDYFVNYEVDSFRKLNKAILVSDGTEWVQSLLDISEDDVMFKFHIRYSNPDNAFSRILSSSNSLDNVMVQCGIRDYLDHMIDIACGLEPNIKQLEEMVDQIAETVMFNAMMGHTRKFYSPQSGAGHQSYDGLDFWKGLNDASNNWIAEREKVWGED